MVVRGCGERVAGGIYITVPLSRHGMPLEHFIQDPPIHEVDVDGEMLPIKDAFGLSALGVTVAKMNKVYHVVDIVGTKYYPDVPDILEETRRYGLSRRISKQTNFSLLGPESHIILAHPAGYIDEYKQYADSEPPDAHDSYPCPRDIDDHLGMWREEDALPESMCARYWWQDVRNGMRYDEESRRVKKDMPAFSYDAYGPPDDITTGRRLAFIARFPIHHLEVIKDMEGGAHEEALKRAQVSGIPTKLEDL